MEKVSIPKAEDRTSPIIRYLHLMVTALALGASVIGLMTQLIEHFQKPKAGPGERTKTGTALIGLTVLRAAPGIIKAAKTLAADAKRSDRTA